MTRSGSYRRALALSTACLGLVLGACSHDLQVKNLEMYSTPLRLSSVETPPNVGILPYTGSPDGLFYFNAIVEQLNANPAIGDLQTDYIPAPGNRFQPDLVLSIQPQVNYRSSGWNFLINWPGFLIFTPAWNGYVYRADIITNVAINDRGGKQLGNTSVPISYSIRHAEMDRTIFTGLAWLEVSLLAFGGGIYNAQTFDRDVIGGLQPFVKSNYSTYVLGQVEPKLRAAAAAVEPQSAPAATGSNGEVPALPAQQQ